MNYKLQIKYQSDTI